MRFVGCVALLGAALAGCQGIADPAAFIAAAEPAVLASNESNRLGREQLGAGNFGLAEQHFRAAVEANGDDGASWVGLAAAYDQLGRFDLADRAYEQATRVEGETLAILNNRGYSRLLRGDRAGALAIFRRALQLYPGTPTVVNNIALARTGQAPNRAVVR